MNIKETIEKRLSLVKERDRLQIEINLLWESLKLDVLNELKTTGVFSAKWKYYYDASSSFYFEHKLLLNDKDINNKVANIFEQFNQNTLNLYDMGTITCNSSKILIINFLRNIKPCNLLDKLGIIRIDWSCLEERQNEIISIKNKFLGLE